MPADLLAGCSGTGWNPKDPMALVTDYRCCSEGIWRDRMEPHGRGVGLLITQRSRVQIPPPPPSLTSTFGRFTSFAKGQPDGVVVSHLSVEGPGFGPGLLLGLEPSRIRLATALAACVSMPGMTWL
jgi:hypothetical protein